jgi:hypothetical protein
MNKKVYKFNQLNGSGVMKVSFYETGCFTITDVSNNEHEAGLWKKVYAEENGRTLKSYFYYTGRLFCKDFDITDGTQRDLASRLLSHWIISTR